MEKMENIESIEFFSKPRGKRRNRLVLSLAKKYLDENRCYLKEGKIFHICGLAIIDQLIKKQDITDLKQICAVCPFKGDCTINH